MLKDLLLHRYHQLDFIDDMRIEEFLDLVLLALEEERKAKHRQEWLALLPLFVRTGKYMSFDEYYKQATGQNIDWRPAEDIIAEIDEAHRRMN